MSRRNPFNLRNTLEHEDIGVSPGAAAPLDFEESMLDQAEHERLEREPGIMPRSLILGATAALLIALLGRLYQLTVSRHDFYLAAADGNRLRIEYLAAPRGAVYDSTGVVLASNKPSFELVADVPDLPKTEEERSPIISQVAGIVSMEGAEIAKLIDSRDAAKFQSVLIKQTLARDEALVLQERASEIPGFRVVDAPIRDYVRTPQAYAHLLGYVGKLNAEEYKQQSGAGYLFNDSMGKAGLESQYEQYLRGMFGERQVEVDARGVIKKIFGQKAAAPGNDLVLNIDSGLQDQLYRSLLNRTQMVGRKRAAAIAMNPQTGQVLALVSLPSYDNNLFAGGIDSQTYQTLLNDKNQPLFDRAVGGTYPPGSTIKPVMATAALENKIIDENTQILDSGKIVIPNPYGGPDSVFYGYNHSGLGLMTVRKAIAMSSDIFFYVVGGGYAPAHIDGMGIEAIARFFRMFKLGEKLGIDLPGEKPGVVPTPDWKAKYFKNASDQKWYLGDTYHTSIGQGDVLVTPLSIVSWVATIASGGKVMKPYIASAIRDNAGRIIKQFSPRQIGQIDASEENIKIVQEGMRGAVLYGTAHTLASLSISAAAKTGTAQFDARDPSRSHAWFSAYAPFENPQIATVVLIEDGGEGGINAVPVVKETLDWWAKNRYQK